MASKRKNYELAYDDKKAGMTYQDIAAKYKVSLSAVQAWQKRYWREWDNVHQESENVQFDEECTEDVHDDVQNDGQVTAAKPDISRPQEVFVPIVAKQIEDTNPARIYAEYSRDNLPQITDREARFVEEYIIDLDKKSAAIRAGYSVANADSLGCRLYSRPDVNAHIMVALAERMKRSGMNADLAIRELGRIARANPANVLAKDGGIRDDANEEDLAAVQAVKVKITPAKGGGEIVEKETRFHDKTRAIELYMKAAGMLIDRKQVDITTTVEEMTDEQRRKRINELKSQLAIDVDFVRVE